jgi:hypothetical protein
VLAQLTPHVLSKPSHAALWRLAGEELLGHADCAHRQRDEAIDQPVGAQSNFERSAANVDYDRSTGG